MGNSHRAKSNNRGLEAHLEQYRRRQKQYLRQLAVILLFLGVAGWFVWGLRDWVKYELLAPPSLTEMGKAQDIDPQQLLHNSFVMLEGITEHRGLSQKMMRGLSFSREEYWYFRLLGSKGVFLEVKADPDRYGIATRLEVTGRVVDPSKDASYSRLLQKYEELFSPASRSAIRIVQVGAKPGVGRTNYIICLGGLGLLLLFNIVSLVRLLMVSVLRWYAG